ncbi:hypothetical protein BH11MYX2_BH11MYX2_40960 [soil metagenome]
MKARLPSNEVFTPTAFPRYTYVPRDDLHHERLLREWVRSTSLIASVSGPSKAGKTVLVQRVVGEGNLVSVSGASVRAPDQLWDRVLDWLGEPHATAASRADATTETKTREKGGTLGIAGVGASVRGQSAHAQGGTDTLQATSARRGLPQVVDQLANTKLALLVDDFHYIPHNIQSDVAQQIKDAASRGVRICVASVPHRADNVVRALPELRGRVMAIDLDYWSRTDLISIPTAGLPLLDLSIDTATLQSFAVEAAGSPQLMQAICLFACNHLGVLDTLEAPRAVTLDPEERRRIFFMTSSVVDFRSLVRALIAGPKARAERQLYTHRDGRQGDVYLTILRAIATDPPKLVIPRAELEHRLTELAPAKSPDVGNLVRACMSFGQIAAQTYAAPSGPAIEWDDHDQVLVVSDPYLLFYLRWSGHLEREADAASAPEITTG